MTDQGEPLSEREIEILRLVATGASNKEIALALTISPNTVKVHLRNIFTKIGVVSRTEATLYALKSGIVSQPVQPGETYYPDRPDAASPLDLATIDRDRADKASRNAMRNALTWIFLGIVVLLIIAALIATNWIRAISSNNATPAANPILNTVAPRWQAQTNLPARLSSMAYSAYQGSIYLIAGENETGVTGQVLAINNSGEWKTLASKPTPVKNVQTAMVGELMYVPGGETYAGDMTGVHEVYDPRLDQWHAAAPLPEKLSAYAMTAFEGNLYLFGGWNGAAYSTKVYRYLPAEDRWQTLSDMPDARGFAAAVQLEGRILIIGGKNSIGDLSSVIAYYPSRDQAGENPWEDAPALPESRSAHSAAVLANSVYLIGGINSVNTSGTLAPIVLSPGANAWQPYDPAPISFGSGAAFVPLGNFLHVLGGSWSGDAGRVLSDSHFTYQALYTVAIPLLSNDPSSEQQPEATASPTTVSP